MNMGHKPDRFNEIDLLRGIACIAVVLFHYLSRAPLAGWMPGALHQVSNALAQYGYLGVHLFFMISGFVILLSARGASPRSFVASRISRLYPAFWAAASLTAATTWLTGDSRFMVSASTYLVNLTMFPHWFKVGYVDGAYWSLAVELHFYIYVWLALRFKLFARIDLLLAAWLAVSAINAIRPMYPVEFWLNAKWAPLFVAGGVCYLVRTQGMSKLRTLMLIASFGLAIYYAVREITFESSHGVGLSASTVIVIISSFYGVFVAIAMNKWHLGTYRIVGIMGALTYPVYLLHSNIGFVVYNKLFAMTQSFAASLVITTLLVLAMAWAVHCYVERAFAPRLRRYIGTEPDQSRRENGVPTSKNQ